MEQRNEWVEPIVKAAMAHKQSEDKYHWTACACCGRALYNLAPKLIAEAERRKEKEVLEKIKKMIDNIECHVHGDKESVEMTKQVFNYWKSNLNSKMNKLINSRIAEL